MGFPPSLFWGGAGSGPPYYPPSEIASTLGPGKAARGRGLKSLAPGCFRWALAGNAAGNAEGKKPAVFHGPANR